MTHGEITDELVKKILDLDNTKADLEKKRDEVKASQLKCEEMQKNHESLKHSFLTAYHIFGKHLRTLIERYNGAKVAQADLQKELKDCKGRELKLALELNRKRRRDYDELQMEALLTEEELQKLLTINDTIPSKFIITRTFHPGQAPSVRLREPIVHYPINYDTKMREIVTEMLPIVATTNAQTVEMSKNSKK
jgi:hypothetical protein